MGLGVAPLSKDLCIPSFLQLASLGEAALRSELVPVWAELMSAFTSCLQTAQAGAWAVVAAIS